MGSVIIGWTANLSDANITATDILTVDLSGYTNGPILPLDTYTCTGSIFCPDVGPEISGLTSTPTSFDVSFGGMLNGETYVFGSAVPEPATWAMMLLGFAGLGVFGLRSGGRLFALREPA